MTIETLIKEYTQEYNVDTTRGQCYNESENLYWWLVEEQGIDQEDLEVVRGEFLIDNPVLLPLTLQDLKTAEYDQFIDTIDSNIYNMYEDELSELIWEFIQEHHKDRVQEFYTIPHAWVEYQGEIIDVTVEQFKASTGNITEDNYIGG